jgi:predicted transcriptional regulator
MTLGQVAAALEAEVVCGESRLSLEVRSVCASDLMSDVLSSGRPCSLLLTGLNHPQAVRTAELAEIQAICFVRGKTPSKETVELARRSGVPLLLTRRSMYLACGTLCAAGLVGRDERPG